jgi:hypothetical protein
MPDLAGTTLVVGQAENHRYFMRTLSFHEWLAHRPDEALAADRLATVIAQAGASGISRDELARAVRLRPDTLQDVLMSLSATGQVAVFKANGELRYRATG